MAVAMHYAEVLAPGTNCVAVLIGQDARDLVQVSQVVRCPGGQQLRQGDAAKRGMLSALGKVCRLEVPGAQLDEVLGAHAGELIQQLRQRLALNFSSVSLAIKGGEGLGLAMSQDDAGAGDPIRTLGVNQMADDVENAP